LYGYDSKVTDDRIYCGLIPCFVNSTAYFFCATAKELTLSITLTG